MSSAVHFHVVQLGHVENTIGIIRPSPRILGLIPCTPLRSKNKSVSMSELGPLFISLRGLGDVVRTGDLRIDPRFLLKRLGDGKDQSVP